MFMQQVNLFEKAIFLSGILLFISMFNRFPNFSKKPEASSSRSNNESAMIEPALCQLLKASPTNLLGARLRYSVKLRRLLLKTLNFQAEKR